MHRLPKIYLASQSPRRRQLLDSLGIPYSAATPLTEEEEPAAYEIEDATVRNAKAKAEHLLPAISEKNAVIVAADTLVTFHDKVMGKPTNREDVLRMLGELSGNIHTVVTGLALLSPQYGLRTSSVKTRVHFRVIEKEEIERYAQTKEPYDKAGSYAVQGLGALFIERLEGSYTNVMGFPIEKFLTELSALTSIPIEQWFLP